jgi:hypothetical protein
MDLNFQLSTCLAVEYLFDRTVLFYCRLILTDPVYRINNNHQIYHRIVLDKLNHILKKRNLNKILNAYLSYRDRSFLVENRVYNDPVAFLVNK